MKYFTQFLAFIIFAFFTISAIGQISHGGTPYNWDSESELAFESYKLPKIDLDARIAEDAINDLQKDLPYRFGQNIPVDIDIDDHGIWTELENGDGLWRIEIFAKGAKSINFIFDQYKVPEGGKVFIYSKDKSQLLGSFTKENTSPINSLGVGLIFSEKAIIEYYEPANVRGEGYLHIDNITHGYRDVMVEVDHEEKGPFGNSGPCNINVNCPEGLPFDIQKRSVAIIVTSGGNSVCSGALVNNVLQDGTPYFLTANHCGPNGAGNWVFYFNHETPGCAGNNGPINQSVSGGTLLASNAESDFALLELNNAPPSSYNVCYSGWDATDLESTVSSAYGIHHPSGDVKKICFEGDAPYHENIGSFVNQAWFIDQWEEGVTEGGSSGSPLFNQNGLIIGQLAGGQAACAGSQNNGLFDFYGRMGVSWTFGNTPSNAIRFWLDPAGSGSLIVPNSCNSELPDLNASLGGFTGIPENTCDLTTFTSSVNVINLGVETITSLSLIVTFNGNTETQTWSGSIEPFTSAFISLGEFTAIEGNNVLNAEIDMVNGEQDDEELGNLATREFIGFDGALEYTVNINLDNFPEETTWSITNQSNQEIASGGPYSDNDDPVSETVCLPADQCFDFTIMDIFGDGICCGFGQGDYEVLDPNGFVVASGGNFDDEETTNICAFLSTNDINESEKLLIYPNPAIDILTIESIGSTSTIVSIFDVSGKKVAQRSSTNSTKVNFDTSILPAGLYVVEVSTTDGNTLRNKVVVNK